MSFPVLTAPSLSAGRKPAHLGLGLGIVTALVLLSGSFYRVPQNEVAYLTRFGKVVDPQAGPILPGLHFKVPFADEADTVSISTDTIKMREMKAFTRDTQEVILQVSVTYNVPPSSAYHLLYEVGRSGNIDIAHNLDAVSNDRVRSIVSQRDVTEIAGEGREKIIAEIKSVITTELNRLFKVAVLDVQIPLLDFSTQYKEAVNRSTLARAQRLQAEQDRERAKVEAETVIVKAKGDAESQYARAEGEARARLTQAKAEAESTKLRGEADAIATRVKIEAAGGIDGYVRQVQAQAATNWKGDVPQVSTGNGGGAQVPLLLPIQLETMKTMQK
jgi:modulator of FtsH protease HflC